MIRLFFIGMILSFLPNYGFACSPMESGEEDDPEQVFQQGMRYIKENKDREIDDSYSKNEDLALSCFEYAAERDHVDAQFNLAGMYFGIDDCFAIKWLTAAGMQNHARAKKVLSRFCILDRTLIDVTFIPYALPFEKDCIFREMMADIGMSDEANTSR